MPACRPPRLGRCERESALACLRLRRRFRAGSMVLEPPPNLQNASPHIRRQVAAFERQRGVYALIKNAWFAITVVIFATRLNDSLCGTNDSFFCPAWRPWASPRPAAHCCTPTLFFVDSSICFCYVETNWRIMESFLRGKVVTHVAM